VRVELFVDPACMWSWLTSRWRSRSPPSGTCRGVLASLQPAAARWSRWPGGLEGCRLGASLRAVRVMQALELDDPGALRRFYEALVPRAVADYHAGRPPFQQLEGAAAAAGLAPAHAGAADDAAWDEPIRQPMAEAVAVIGEGVGTPALVLHRDPPAGLLGPVIGSPPTGAAAVRLWDAVVAFAAVPSLLELSRPRSQRPEIAALR
jgi:hypothetical protein